MNNQFCKKCGQANFPDAGVCTKCGNTLNRATNNPYGLNEEPLPTIMAGHPFPNPAAPKRTEKQSNTKYFVIGGIVVVLVLFVGLIGIAGIGALVYFSDQGEVVENTPERDKKTDDGDKTDDRNDNSTDGDKDDDTSLSDIKFPPTASDDDTGDSSGNGSVTDAQLLNFFLKEKPTVGKYQLKKVKTTDSRDQFPNRTAGVTAEYEKGSVSLTHQVALYSSTDSLQEDFADYKSKAKSGGGKIQTSKDTSIVYIRGSLVYLAFYNPQGGFHVISSPKGNDVLEYHNAYFGVQ